MKTKILYYNWIPFTQRYIGGGVNRYQRNLIEQLDKSDEYEVYFLSAGVNYSVFKKKPYLKQVKNKKYPTCKIYEIVNSPVFAPAVFNRYGEAYFKDTEVFDMVTALVKTEDIKIIHLNNIEGLPINVLKIKEVLPDIKVIYSLHNYFLFCPNVKLWSFKGNNCNECRGGKECAYCHTPPSALQAKVMNFLYRVDITTGSSFFTKLFDKLAKIKKKHKAQQVSSVKVEEEENYQRFLEINTQYANKYIDCMLAVSKRVRDLSIQHGLDSNKLKVSYIGTKVAETAAIRSNANINTPIFRIAFLGYMMRDKGFYFLLDALTAWENEITQNIEVIFAAQITDTEAKTKVIDLKKKYYDIKLVDGYSSTGLDSMLKGVHLGIVPSLWEDNMPQVAIEMVAKGVPVLTTELGGASELCSMPEFVFKSGDYRDFYDKLTFIFNNRDLLSEYWSNRMHLVTMQEHIDYLKNEVYR